MNHFPTYSIAELETAVLMGNGSIDMLVELRRREAVAAGDKSQMTPTEKRLKRVLALF